MSYATSSLSLQPLPPSASSSTTKHSAAYRTRSVLNSIYPYLLHFGKIEEFHGIPRTLKGSTYWEEEFEAFGRFEEWNAKNLKDITPYYLNSDVVWHSK